MSWIPKPGEVLREALIVLGGAIIAAVVVGQFPALKKYLQDQWAAK